VAVTNEPRVRLPVIAEKGALPEPSVVTLMEVRKLSPSPAARCGRTRGGRWCSACWQGADDGDGAIHWIEEGAAEGRPVLELVRASVGIERVVGAGGDLDAGRFVIVDGVARMALPVPLKTSTPKPML